MYNKYYVLIRLEDRNRAPSMLNRIVLHCGKLFSGDFKIKRIYLG